MENFKTYNIVFSGLKNGKHHFDFEIDKAFFDLFGTEVEFEKPHIKVNIELDKHDSFLDFSIQAFGIVDLICDISGENFKHSLENSTKVLVKFGSHFDDSNEEIITIPSTDYQFNIAQLIYEIVVLSIPMKKIAPNAQNNDSYNALLEKYSPKLDQDKENTNEEIDPRWAILSQLKNKSDNNNSN